MREKFRQFMIGRYGTDGLNQFLSIASIVLLLISLLTRFSLFTWLGLVLLVPALEPLFAVAPLSIGMVGAIVGLAFGSMLVIQLLKWIRR